MNTEIRNLEDSILTSQLRNLVRSERKITAEIIEVIKEVDRRRLFLDLGFSSLYSFLVEDVGYTPAAAQRRIDAARIFRDLPEIKEELKEGHLNLTQVSILAQNLRQLKKQNPNRKVSPEQKREILNQVKNQSLQKTQVILSQKLDLEIKAHDRKHYQKDESIRYESTFSKEEMAQLYRVREIISHRNPNPSLNELVSFLADYFLKREDPLRKEVKTRHCAGTRPKVKVQAKTYQAAAPHEMKESTSATSVDEWFEMKPQLIEKVGAEHRFEVLANSTPTSAPEAETRQKTRYIRAIDRREILKKNPCCQWKDPKTGKTCGSKFFLQVDHKKSIWSGGKSNPENLQVLCGVHNRLKYKLELTRLVGSPMTHPSCPSTFPQK
jgi:hypothetical protein